MWNIIVDPITNKNVSIYSSKGIKILNNYINIYGGQSKKKIRNSRTRNNKFKGFNSIINFRRHKYS